MNLSKSFVRFTFIGVGICFFLGLLGTAFLTGFAVSKRQWATHWFWDKVDRKLERILVHGNGPIPSPRLSSTRYTTNLLHLNSDVGVVKLDTAPQWASSLGQKGGGLTSFGDDVLLLPYSGHIFAATSPSTIRTTKVEGPDNYRAAYLAVAEDPAFAQYEFAKDYLRYNDILYFRIGDQHGLLASYTEYHPKQVCFTNTVARLTFPANARSIDDVTATASDWQPIFRTSPCQPFKRRMFALEGHMAGGRLAFQQPSTLVLTSGDFHLDGMRSNGKGIAQDPAQEYGKIIAVDLLTSQSRILSQGHRNVQGVVVDEKGQIFVTEHGPAGGDEFNLIQEGRNYGWPIESLGISYSGAPLPESTSFARHDQFEPPLHAWVPSIAVSGLTQVKGFHQAWEGDFLASSLKTQSLYRIRKQDGRVLYSEPIFIGARLRYIHQHTNGQLVAWTDNEELIFLTAQDKGNEATLFAEYLEEAALSENVKTGLESAISKCVECHSFSVGDHGQAPSLARIFNAPVAGTSYPGYSEALRAQPGKWDRDKLRAFLTAPQAFAPGTAMPAPPTNDPDIITAIVDYLETVPKRF